MDSRTISQKPQLPLEIVAQIISNLERTEENRPLLRALSTTNRVLRHAARSVLFRSVTTAKGREYFSFQVRVLTEKEDTARHVRHLRLRPSSVLPFSQYKKGYFYTNDPGHEQIMASLLVWRSAYDRTLSSLFEKCASSMESLCLDCSPEEGERVDAIVHSIMVQAFKGVWGRFHTPKLKKLELRFIDYDGLSDLSERLPETEPVEEESGWQQGVYYDNFGRIASFEANDLKGPHNDRLIMRCNATDDDTLQTLRLLDELCPWPPQHFEWALEREDAQRPQPLMAYVRHIARAAPSLELTRLGICKRRFGFSDYPLHVVLSHCESLIQLHMSEVFLYNEYDSWFLVFRRCRQRLRHLLEVNVRKLGYDNMSGCPRESLKLCAVHPEDRMEMVAFWEDVRDRRAAVPAAACTEDDGEDLEEMEELDVNDKTVFCRSHPVSIRFERALRTNGENPDPAVVSG